MPSGLGRSELAGLEHLSAAGLPFPAASAAQPHGRLAPARCLASEGGPPHPEKRQRSPLKPGSYRGIRQV
ncbi:hypothetical protein VE23_10755 [Paenibacillus sp. D9]|nr:hypothetical protein VE23_10755 [Paenibacillus sp. D9]